MKLFKRLKARWTCHKTGHIFEKIQPSLGGDWIQCTQGGHLDEFIPGVHEPKGNYL